MSYDFKYINTEAAIIESLLINADSNLLDVSFTINGNKIIIQVIHLSNHILPIEKRNNLICALNFYDEILINEFQISRENFNENKGDWLPKYYNWLDFVIFSKAEVL